MNTEYIVAMARWRNHQSADESDVRIELVIAPTADEAKRFALSEWKAWFGGYHGKVAVRDPLDVEEVSSQG